MRAAGNAFGCGFKQLLGICLCVGQPNGPTACRSMEVGGLAWGSYHADILKPVLCTVLVAVLAMVIATVAPTRTPPSPCPHGRTGSKFADTYASFAPWFALHERFAEHLFSGSELEIPKGLSSCCEHFPTALARLQLTIAAQSDSPTAIPNARLLELRVEADAFCAIYRPILETIDASDGADPAFLEEASAAGLFARIFELYERLEDLFTTSFDGIDDDQARWCFAVAFTVRTLANRERIERIDEDVAGIFYGKEGASGPPFKVSEAVAEAMAGLIVLADRDLTPSESERAGRWAVEIHAAFVSDPS